MTVSFEEKRNVEQIVQETLQRLSCPVNISVEWKHLRSRLGDATYSLRRVRFSTHFWPHMPAEKRRNTVIHEVCHIVARWLAQGNAIKPHGREWQALMRDCGEVPKATWSVPESVIAQGVGVRRRHAQDYVVVCGCTTRTITKNRFTRMQRGTTYSCKLCRQVLRAA